MGNGMLWNSMKAKAVEYNMLKNGERIPEWNEKFRIETFRRADKKYFYCLFTLAILWLYNWIIMYPLLFNFIFYSHIHIFMMWSFARAPFIHAIAEPTFNTNRMWTLFIVIAFTPLLFDLSSPIFYLDLNSKQRIRGHYLLIYVASIAFCLLDWVEWWICWPYPTIAAWCMCASIDIIFYCYFKSISKAQRVE